MHKKSRALLYFVFFLSVPLHAAVLDSELQVQVASWLGTWEFNEPRGGPQFLILHTNGSASIFSGHSNRSDVTSGHWKFDGKQLEVNWTDQGKHVLERDGSNFRMSYVTAGTSVYQFSVPAVRIPADYLGSWAVDQSNLRNQEDRENEDSSFFGNWAIQSNDGSVYYILIRNDRTAATSINSQTTSKNGKMGTWVRHGSELHITWEDAAYTIFQAFMDSYGVVNFNPGEVLDEKRAEAITARRIRRDAIDANWLESFNAERDAIGWGIRFKNQRAAQRFYRGNWLIDRSDFGVERISLGRMGGIRSTRRPTARGEWRLSSRDLFLNWEDGFRQVMTPIGLNFVLFEYAVGRPIDAVPTKVFQALPKDLSKLSKAQRERKSEHAVFEAISERTDGDRNWFTAIWPFGAERQAEFPADTFVQGDERSLNNPWWWPFWSENEVGIEGEGTASGKAVEADTIAAGGVAPAKAAAETGKVDRPYTEKRNRWLAIP